MADAFDAMMSDRHYRSKLNFMDARAQLVLGAGTQFDKEVVDRFLAILEEFPDMTKELASTYR